MKKHKLTAINLLPEDAFAASLIGKFLLWSLSIGRYVVVFTELIVIISFLSRFKLDRDLTDLNEAINRQKAIVLSYGDLEIKLRADQERLNFIKKEESSPKPPFILNLLNQTTPPEIKLDTLSINQDKFTLTGSSLTSRGLSTLLNNLLQNPSVANVAVGDIVSEDQLQGITFNLNISLKNSKL